MARFRVLAVTFGVAAGLSAAFLPPANAAPIHALRVCAPAAAGSAACLAYVQADAANHPLTTAKPSGYGPHQIQAAYKLRGALSGGRTVAIVDAYDAPTAEHDLAVYRRAYGLAPCTTANGCFRKVGQDGGAVPRVNAGWAQEISLDIDMVSATCPDCKILLVEANSPTFADLGAAVDYAASQPGVVAISNSYGGSDLKQRPAYDHPGIAITASTGDSGYGVMSPASFTSVIAVGGTSLVKDATSSRGWTETAWNGAGSGCSTLNAKPRYQTSATQCTGKANADVSAVADPATGVAVYDSTPYQGSSGWMVFGGTSASSPIIASVYALAGHSVRYPGSTTWHATSSLNDVTVGSNGACTTLVWCTAGTGWDGPTGLGTPNGLSAF